MDLKKIVGVAAIGGAVAYLFKDHIFTTAAATPESPAATPPATGTGPAPAGGGSPATPPAAPPPAAPIPVVAALPITKEVLMKATYDWDTARLLGTDPRAMQSADSWNWYRNEAGKSQVTYDLFTPGNRGELISAVTYLTRRQALGLEI